MIMKKIKQDDIKKLINNLDFTKISGNLIPIITQDISSDKILMLGFATAEAVKKSLETGYVHYYSRSRNVLWKKGETSGNLQEIKEIFIDCDNDSILYKVKQVGGACHEGYYSCFHKKFEDGSLVICEKRLFDPQKIYGKSKE